VESLFLWSACFANQVPARVEKVAANRAADDWVDGGEDWPDRDYIVEVTALAALCNLIADCIPLKQVSRVLSCEKLSCPRH
jgi:hypothetical protein